MRPLSRGIDQLGRGGALSKQMVRAWEMFAEAVVDDARSFTVLLSSLAGEAVTCAKAAYIGGSLAVHRGSRWDAWGRDMHRLGHGGALCERMVARSLLYSASTAC